MNKRLAIITTHPIQYNAPLFAMLQARNKIEVKVFYTWGAGVLKDKFDPGFGKEVSWDIPLLDGYEYSFVLNKASDPGSHHYSGIDNPSLIDEIQSWRADALLVYGWAFKSHLKVMRHFKNRIPVLFRGDSTSIQKMPFLKKVVRGIFLKWVYRHVDYALYVGTHNLNYFLQYGLRKEQLVFAPHAIDNNRFQQDAKMESDPQRLSRNFLGIPMGEMIFLYAGKLDDNKNVQLLAKAFCEVEQAAHLVIAGNGVSEENLKRDFGKKSNIHFVPFQNQSQMPSLYALADVFVLPSISETWGLAINEAMACGKAVLVSSGCGAAIDLVMNGENGYVFNNNDLMDLKHKIELLLADRDLIKKMGRRSSDIISSWSFQNSCQAIEDIITQKRGSF